MIIKKDLYFVLLFTLLFTAALCTNTVVYADDSSQTFIPEDPVITFPDDPVITLPEDPVISWDEPERQYRYVSVSYGSSAVLTVKSQENREYERFTWRDGQGQEIADADGPSYTVPSVTYLCKYTCVAIDSDGNATTWNFEVSVDNELRAWSKNNPTKVKPNEQAVLQVSASCKNGGLTYQWESEEHGEIPGANAAVYTTWPVTKWTWYQCRVADDYGNSTSVYFDVSVDNGLQASSSTESRLAVSAGEQVVLRVDASCDRGNLTYQWSNDMQGDIPGANNPVYTTQPVMQKEWYSCAVSDEYGNIEYISFNIIVDNELHIAPSGSVPIYIESGDSVTMTVNASCLNGNIVYKWYDYGTPNTTGSWDSRTLLLEDSGASSSYTQENVTKSTRFSCEVADEYGNEEFVGFQVVIGNDLTVTTEHGDPEAGVIHVFVEWNTPAELQVIASCREGEIHYEWGPEDLFSETNENRCTTLPITKIEGCFCKVSDDYGNQRIVVFNIHVDNKLTAEADGSNVVHSEIGDAVNLRINASCSNGNMTYQWYKINKNYYGISREMLDGETSSTLAVSPSEKLSSYCCEVTDDYMNRKAVEFTVVVPDIVLPSDLKTIESGAFEGVENVIIWIPPSVTHIDDNVFESSVKLTGESGSYAEEYILAHTSDPLPGL